MDFSVSSSNSVGWNFSIIRNSPEIGSDGWPIENPDPEIRWPSDPMRQQVVTWLWLKSWHKQTEAAKKAHAVKFHFEAEKKLIAAEQAHRLLQQFGRDISDTCRALTNGQATYANAHRNGRAAAARRDRTRPATDGDER
jgi:hypothetical protein